MQFLTFINKYNYCIAISNKLCVFRIRILYVSITYKLDTAKLLLIVEVYNGLINQLIIT